MPGDEAPQEWEEIIESDELDIAIERIRVRNFVVQK